MVEARLGEAELVGRSDDANVDGVDGKPALKFPVHGSTGSGSEVVNDEVEVGFSVDTWRATTGCGCGTMLTVREGEAEWYIIMCMCI